MSESLEKLVHDYDPQSTDEQITIYNWVRYGTGHLIIKARAGSGKTSTLVEICRILPADAKQITFLAFNVHIKKELKLKMPKHVFCYTTHGLGYSAIMRKYKNVIVDEFKVDKVLTKYSKIWNLESVPNKLEYMINLKKIINHARLSLVLDKKYIPDLCEKYDLLFDAEDINRVFIVLEEMLNDKNSIDYVDMVYLPVVDNKIWLFPQDFILVDEAQDLSKAQHELIKKAIKKDKTGKIIGRMIFCGDDLQCQPENTLVLLSNGETKNIQDLIIGDRVVSYSRKTVGGFVGFTKQKGRGYLIENIEKRQYNDELIVLKANNNISKYTPNHKCFIRFRKDKTVATVLYLMEKDGYFRIGICPLWTKDKQDSMTCRPKHENADNFWMLSIYNTRFDAYLMEQYYSVMYSIPQLIFTHRQQKGNINQEVITKFYKLFNKNDLYSKANELLKLFKRNINYPIWSKGGKNYLSKMHISTVYACNIIPEYMEVVLFDQHNKKTRSHGKHNKIDNIIKPTYSRIDSINYEHYNGFVYSLKVEKHETYVADNILTHNSIYAFAGADAFSFNNLSKIPNTIVLPLTTTFRCAKNIVLEANKIVKDIKATSYAKDGIVRKGSALMEAVAGDFILSRKTFPLVKMFFELLVEDRKAFINGSDIGMSLIEMIGNKPTTAQLDASLTNMLSEYREKLRKHGILKYSEDVGYIALNDKIRILRFLMNMVNDVDLLKQRIIHIFKESDSEGIMLSTVHKAKGLEANRVFIIMPKDMPLRTSQAWQYQQEMNLKYIAITRAKYMLVYDMEWKVNDGTFNEFTEDHE